ncbi:MAG: outer membrane protein assembly factor BamD [Phycisphaerales bacterium]|nr:MAG: outer membrane protein assembly factor BamD [Phycisphaerales bacterium]
MVLYLRPLLLALLAQAILLAAAAVALGQENYTLTDNDTWARIDGVEPGSPEGQLVEARRALAAGEPIRAENLATQWIDRYEQHPILPEAYLLRGDALMAQREYYRAAFDYEFIARVFPGSDAFITALERELQIARLFGSGLKRKLWGMRIADASDDAEELLIRIQERLPGSRLAEEAGMELGDFYFRRRNMTLAVEMYSLFVENYPNSEQINKARKRLIYAHLAAFKGPEFDATGLYNARAESVRLKALAPIAAEEIGVDALIARIDESNARKMLHTTRWYLRTGDLIAAEFTIRRLVERYPRTLAAADALRLVQEILPRLPQSVREEGPDYEALRTDLLRGPEAATGPASPERNAEEDRP